MVGRKYEAGGIAKDGAKMVMAVANAQARLHYLYVNPEPECLHGIAGAALTQLWPWLVPRGMQAGAGACACVQAPVLTL